MDNNQPGPSGYVRPLHPAFDDLDERIEQRYREQEQKIQAHRTRREVEKVHAQFNRRMTGPNYGAQYEANHWISKHGGRHKSEPGSGSARNTIPVRNAGLGVAEGRAAPRPGPRPSLVRSTARAAETVSRPGNSEVHQRCDVLNCEIEFSSLGRFLKHTEGHNHSPCHPARHLENGRCDSSTPIFCCTTCGELYKSAEACHVHMEEVGHDHLQAPVPVVGYICLQCYLVFPNAANCLMHQHKEDHRTNLHPLTADKGPIQPQYLTEPVYEAFLKACRAVPSSVECLDCGMAMPDSATLNSHVLQGHQIMSFTQKTPADVWPSLMCGYTCVQCQRLYQTLPPDGLGAFHQCSPTMMGMIIENDCNTTTDFILRRSLSHIPLVPGEGVEDAPLDPDGEAEGGRRDGDATEAGEATNDEVPQHRDNSICIIDDSLAEEAECIDLTESPAVVNRSLSIEVIGTKSADGAAASAPRQIRLIDPAGEEHLSTVKHQGPGVASGSLNTHPGKVSPKKGGPVKRTPAAIIASANSSTNSTPEASPPNPGTACEVCTASRWRDPKKGSPAPKCVCDNKKQHQKGHGSASPAGSPALAASAKKRKRKSDERKALSHSAKKLKTNAQLVLNEESPSSCEAKKSLTVTFSTNNSKQDRLASLLEELDEDDDEIEMIDLQDLNCDPQNRKGHSPREDNLHTDPNLNPDNRKGCSPMEDDPEELHRSELRRSPRLIAKPTRRTRVPTPPKEKPKGPILPKNNLPSTGQKVVGQKASGSTSYPSQSASGVSPVLPSVNQNAINSKSKPRGPSPSVSASLPSTNNQISGQRGPSSRTKPKGPSPRVSPTLHSANHPTLASASQNKAREPPALKELDKMRHIIYVDFDNWHGFFQKLYQPLPDNVFVWGFHGGATNWKEPLNSVAYRRALARQCFYMNDRCGTRKDAADFAICMHVGRMDERLPSHIPFTILSGDKGFEEIERQMAGSHRRVKVINPHHQQADEIFTLLISMVDV